MDRDSLISLALATHRVADSLPAEIRISSLLKKSMNRALADLLLVAEYGISIQREQLSTLIPRALREVEFLKEFCIQGEEAQWIHPSNFLRLEQEYSKIEEWLSKQQKSLEGSRSFNLEQPQKREEPSYVPQASPQVQEKKGVSETRAPEARPAIPQASGLSDRQRKILQMLKERDKLQVWELQQVLPQVTKRTLRRDLDSLLKSRLVERKGEWNMVFYRLRESSSAS